MNVLVTDGDQRAALAVVRSLGRAGHRVAVAADRSRALAGASRHCSAGIVLPDALARPADYSAALRRYLSENGVDVVIPITDASLSATLALKDDLSDQGVLLPFADPEAYAAISDKKQVLERARALGIAVPTQSVLESPPRNADRNEPLRYPVVVKPVRSVVQHGAGRVKTQVTYAGDPDELTARLGAVPESGYPILLQQRIHGPGVGMFLLRWGGQTMAAFAHRRLREKPPSGGVSVLRESRPLDPDLLERSVELLDSFDWRGPAMVEYKIDAATGVPYLMEVNGRYWGSLQLAVDAGVDFPAIHVDVAAGNPRDPVTRYHSGIRTRWLLGDIDHLIARLRRSRAELNLPDGAPGRMGAVVEFARAFGPGTRNEVMRWSDPRPALVEWKHWMSQAL